MISTPYPTKGTACAAAKVHAKATGIKKFMLLLDLDKRQYHFSDREKSKESKLIPFARYELIKGKWRDKTMLTGNRPKTIIYDEISFAGGTVVRS